MTLTLPVQGPTEHDVAAGFIQKFMDSKQSYKRSILEYITFSGEQIQITNECSRFEQCAKQKIETYKQMATHLIGLANEIIQDEYDLTRMEKNIPIAKANAEKKLETVRDLSKHIKSSFGSIVGTFENDLSYDYHEDIANLKTKSRYFSNSPPKVSTTVKAKQDAPTKLSPTKPGESQVIRAIAPEKVVPLKKKPTKRKQPSDNADGPKKKLPVVPQPKSSVTIVPYPSNFNGGIIDKKIALVQQLKPKY